MRIEFEAFGEQLVSRTLLRWAGRADDATPAFEAIADRMAGMEDARFDAQGYGLWPQLAESTSLRKAAAGLDPRILHATLDLRRSLTDKADESHLRVVGEDFLIFGTTVEYAGYHQKGAGVPRRRPLQFSEPEKQTLVKTLQRFLATGVAA